MPLALKQPLFLLFLAVIPLIWITIHRSTLKDRPQLSRIYLGGIRSLLALTLVLALSDPVLLKSSDHVNLFYLMDISQSIFGQGEDTALEAIRDTSAGMGEEDRAGLIIFGKSPSVEVAMGGDFTLSPYRSTLDRSFTNIHEALKLAVGKFPAKGKNRIMLLSDGNQNLDDAIEMAYLAQSLDIEIYPAPLDTWFRKNEVFVEKMETPESVPLDTPFEIRLLVSSTKAGPGEVALLKNGLVLTAQNLTLQAGKNVVRFTDQLTEKGLYLYSAVINAPFDSVFQNNEGLSFTQGAKRSEVLYLSDREAASPLARALTQQGLQIVREPLKNLPRSMQGLLEYRAIIMDNVSGKELSFTAMENLENYVRDLGGGLVMVGGDRSFGLGGYLKTPVEKALPVYMDVPTNLELPGFCLILVLDKSASMAGNLRGKNKLEGAKVAAFSAIEMLNPMDKTAILAFDTEFQWIVPITRADQRREIAEKLSSLIEGGGTDLYPGLREAFRILKTAKAAKKHVIILSDGLTEKGNFKWLVNAMREERITVSTVSIGSDADVEIMKSIAAWGGGRAYYTDDVEKIPRIFVGETKIAAQKVIVEKDMTPSLVTDHEMLAGFAPLDFPPVKGLIITYPKPGSRTLLTTDDGPLLAAWQYGLGRSVAFTSDLDSRWSGDWLTWDRYGQFAGQMIKWVQRKETIKNYTPTFVHEQGRGTFAVDVTDTAGRFQNNLDLNAQVLFPSKKNQTITLEQIAPGRYQGSFPTEEIGAYYLTLSGSEADAQIFGYGIPYTQEYSTQEVNEPLLQQLASISRGRILSPEDDPRRLFNTDSDVREHGNSLWPYLIIVSMALLVADVAVRKFQSIGRLR
jgi:uncharacterized membrane protein